MSIAKVRMASRDDCGILHNGLPASKEHVHDFSWKNRDVPQSLALRP